MENQTQTVTTLVETWIKDYYEFLKDGHARGLHPIARDKLIKRIDQLLNEKIDHQMVAQVVTAEMPAAEPASDAPVAEDKPKPKKKTRKAKDSDE